LERAKVNRAEKGERKTFESPEKSLRNGWTPQQWECMCVCVGVRGKEEEAKSCGEGKVGC
jgi:hypothetical protein